jgi:hypothetical protein
MDSFDLTGLCCEPEGFGRDPEQLGSVGEVEPWLDTIQCWPEHRDLVM